MEYLVEGSKYSLSYKQLREHHTRFCGLSDEEFMNELPSALHLATVICYLKELPTYNVLSDKGIIHQLVHLLEQPDEPTNDLQEIRQQYQKDLFLSP